MIVLAAGPVAGQPRQRRAQQAEPQRRNPSSAMSRRAQISFPTGLAMPEEVVWRRDIYREIDLTHEANTGLYHPVDPQGRQVNLFTYIFKLAQNGYIPVYEYPTDGSDVFTDEARIPMKTVLDNYHIFYEEQDGRLKVDNSDIPSAEVRKFYLKESAYYDQANSSFHVKVLALCPVMMREDEFTLDSSKTATPYPLFWVKYSDLEPFLGRQPMMTSSLNNAATMSMDDFFTLNMYRGSIYKTNNAQGKTLLQLCDGDAGKVAAEQQRIEAELAAFRKTIFGDPARRDSLDSIAAADPRNVKAAAKARPKAARPAKARQPKVRRAKSSSGAASSSGGGARVTVRRQRH